MSKARPDLAERVGSLLARPAISTLMTLLNGAGAETRIVGGAVRNTLLNLPTTDIDLATTLKPEKTMAKASEAGLKVVPTGLAHGTVTVVVEGAPFEVTTLRHDLETDGRHAIVAFSDSFEVDALRRDFTINQLSLSADGIVHDYAGGLSDIAARTIRFIGDPAQRIREDYLRIMRFFRFHAEYGFGALDAAGLAACLALKGGMARLSAERIRAELLKLLMARHADAVLPSFVDGLWREVAGDVPAHLAALMAARHVFPASDAVAWLAALAVREAGHAAELDRRLKLSSAERKRLDDTAKGLALLGPPAALTGKAYQMAGLHLGARAAHDALGCVADALGTERAAAMAALAIPVSPFRGTVVLSLGVPAGPNVGEIIARANLIWADRGFSDDPEAQRQCLTDALAT